MSELKINLEDVNKINTNLDALLMFAQLLASVDTEQSVDGHAVQVVGTKLKEIWKEIAQASSNVKA